MQLARVSSYLGALACLVVAVALAVPYLVVEGQPELLSAYYTAGPLGAAGTGFLAVLGVVIFLSGERGSADPELIAGIVIALGVALFVFTVLWAVSISESVLFSFPPEYAWLEYHRWAVAVPALVVLAAAIGYTRAVLP
ncbi:DUF7548 family protein [Haloferacaceae archaeon DSL9]